MNFVKTSIPEVLIIEPKVFCDDRGYFFESFSQRTLEKQIPKTEFVQDNESKSEKGVLRGLHYQLPPFAQSKLVRVIEGVVLDVAVDIREGSPTFGQHVAVELSAKNKKQQFIPRGFAHGFVVLSDTAIFSYKVDNYYAPQSERAIRFDDPSLNIDWRLSADYLKLSEKDKVAPLFDKADLFDYKEDLYV